MIDLDELERLAKGGFRTYWPEDILALTAEVRRLREDLQASKLLAHANAEMFKAEKVDGDLYRWLRDQNSNYLSVWSVDRGYEWVGEDLTAAIEKERGPA